MLHFEYSDRENVQRREVMSTLASDWIKCTVLLQSWKTLGPGLSLVVTFTCTTYFYSDRVPAPRTLPNSSDLPQRVLPNHIKFLWDISSKTTEPNALKCPLNSPCPNPIEHLWAALERAQPTEAPTLQHTAPKGPATHVPAPYITGHHEKSLMVPTLGSPLAQLFWVKKTRLLFILEMERDL